MGGGGERNTGTVVLLLQLLRISCFGLLGVADPDGVAGRATESRPLPSWLCVLSPCPSCFMVELSLWRFRFSFWFLFAGIACASLRLVLESAMETSPSLDGAVELSEGLSLVPCTLISLSFVRADVSVRPVDEWKLKEGLTALFKKSFGLTVADRDLVVQKEKNYFKKRRDEPIAHGVLHLWGSKPEGDPLKVGGEGADWRKYVAESVNGIELNVSGLKLRCIARIKETNNFDALKRSWEEAFGPRRGGG